MKITNMVAREVEFKHAQGFRPAWAPGAIETSVKGVALKIETDEGITGIAGHEYFGPEVQVVEKVKPFLIGQDPFKIERHITVLRNVWPFFGTAQWFIEVALWDIIGKACGQPIYRLWGGYNDKILAYASTGEVRDPVRRAEDARRLVAEGFRAIKLRCHNERMADDIEMVAAVRDAVGPNIQLIVDANQAGVHNSDGVHPIWTYERAVRTARELEKLDVLWLEEPLPRHDYKGLAQLCREVTIPIAGGEVNQGVHDLLRLIEEDCYDILQPDVTLSEGMFQVRIIAGLASYKRKWLTPHTWGTGLGFAANLQLAASIPNCPYIEFPYDPPTFMPDAYQGMLKKHFTIDDEGYIHLPKEPGLGVEFSEFVEEQFRE